jgi:hypothetical protein
MSIDALVGPLEFIGIVGERELGLVEVGKKRQLQDE